MSFYVEILETLGLDEIIGMLDYNVVNYGGKAVYIDGFTDIISIENDKVVLRAKKNKIIVCGELSVHRLEDRSVIIRGRIVSVSTEDGRLEK